ncbi:MAG: hypothetical protein C5B43_00390 [Verrucomicrobia bacterium]|nr:MAG: hypothetical protein C5B43_00390 [Verrucomicrobiota bacterium]
MQKSQAIKETLQTIINNLVKERDHIQGMINDIEKNIKKNKEKGNIAELNNLSPAEKNEVQKFINEHIEKDKEAEPQENESKFESTSAKKLMPKMKQKV